MTPATMVIFIAVVALALVAVAIALEILLGPDPDLGRVRDPREPIDYRAHLCGEASCTVDHAARNRHIERRPAR